MTDTSSVFAAALNALLIKRYDKMTCFFDEAVINGCIEDARKIVALAENGNKEDKIIILPSLETKSHAAAAQKQKSNQDFSIEKPFFPDLLAVAGFGSVVSFPLAFVPCVPALLPFSTVHSEVSIRKGIPRCSKAFAP